jgi:hypothetical protein
VTLAHPAQTKTAPKSALPLSLPYVIDGVVRRFDLSLSNVNRRHSRSGDPTYCLSTSDPYICISILANPASNTMPGLGVFTDHRSGIS